MKVSRKLETTTSTWHHRPSSSSTFLEFNQRDAWKSDRPCSIGRFSYYSEFPSYFQNLLTLNVHTWYMFMQSFISYLTETPKSLVIINSEPTLPENFRFGGEKLPSRGGFLRCSSQRTTQSLALLIHLILRPTP